MQVQPGVARPEQVRGRTGLQTMQALLDGVSVSKESLCADPASAS
jgi:hypothetical protein